VGKNRELGKDNKLLWHISDDLKHFKELTIGHPIIMGRKTFESIGKPLPGRVNIVITRDKNWTHKEVEVVHSLEEALELAGNTNKEKNFIVGGSQIYEQALSHVDKLYLTLINDEKEADSFFPEYEHFFKKKTSEDPQTDEKTDLHYKWVTLEK
jgi:dihydrofolate reductase